MVDGMNGGMDGVLACISACKYASKSELLSFEWSEEEQLKDKPGSSEKSQSLGDESSRLIGGLFKKETDISNSDLSESESISDIWGNYLTLALKA